MSTFHLRLAMSIPSYQESVLPAAAGFKSPGSMNRWRSNQPSKCPDCFTLFWNYMLLGHEAADWHHPRR